MMFHVEQNKKNLHCETKDYLVSGQRFRIYLDKNGIIGKTVPVPKRLEMYKYYQSRDYYPHSLNKKKLSAFLYHFSRKFMHKKKLMWMKKYINQNTRVLDYGCGTGEFVKFLRENSIKAYGYDPNIKFNDGNSSKYFVDKEKWKKQKYDIIVLWHVLEHTYNPFNLIESLKTNLRKSGKIFIAIPNFKSYDSKYYGKYWAGYDVPRHLWHFTRKSILKLAVESRFQVVREKWLLLDTLYVSFMSEKQMSSIAPLFLGLIVGFLSILRSLFTKESSSFFFVLKKL